METIADVVERINGPAGVQALKELVSKSGSAANQTLGVILIQIEELANKTKTDIDSVKSDLPGLLLLKFSKEAVDVEFIRTVESSNRRLWAVSSWKQEVGYRTWNFIVCRVPELF